MDVHTHHRPLDICENIIEHLKKKYIRITETRKAIIAYIMNSHEHPSVDKIYRDLLSEHPDMGLAMVYNSTKVLVDEGFVAELKTTDDTTTYYDFMGHQHINIVCKNYGEITGFMDADATDIGEEAYERIGYQTTEIQPIVYGICPKCQEELKAAGKSFTTYYEDK